MSELEEKFNKQVLAICDTCYRVLKVNFTSFLTKTHELGVLKAVKNYIRQDGVPEEFIKPVLDNRPDLTIENLVVKDEYKSLFTDEEIKICNDRIKLLVK